MMPQNLIYVFYLRRVSSPLLTQADSSSEPPSHRPHDRLPGHAPFFLDAIFLNPTWRTILTRMIFVSSFPNSTHKLLVDGVYRNLRYNKTRVLRKLSPDTRAYFSEGGSYEPEWQDTRFGVKMRTE
ncbi:hypothetical protein BDW02DRAFT_529028 [Decorospora gaudefroyi]|uniref:Uncharacterized protein n=1 Tax=Decorospora gaudefroyi TaxID=184978 RepID=A0A6A5K8W6_9PLEO|nr:hypothetical protein BDW02DRAFT_529028 [Decorospora gaudefroyi]